MQRTNVCKFAVLAALAFAVVLLIAPKTALGQDVPFQVSYFSNSTVPGAPDGTLRLVNDGAGGDASPAGDICAAIYVFSFDEQLQECCSCKITPNGLLTLSINNNLVANQLSRGPFHRGVIKTVSTAPVNGTCNAGSWTIKLGLHGWTTHIQHVTATTYSITEERNADASLSAAEAADLQEDCLVNVIDNGSGFGVCDCTDRSL